MITYARSSVSSSLISVLKDELKIEKESYRISEELKNGPPAPWEFEDCEGKNVFGLKRTFKNEEILIRVDIDDQPPIDDLEEFEDEAEMPLPPCKFNVMIAKENGAGIVFEIESDGEYMNISHLALDMDDDENEDPSIASYTGPVFAELDTTLQQGFYDYLEERGVTAELGLWLMEALSDKMSTEYMAWLQRVREFVAS